jgi:hypothetical protein
VGASVSTNVGLIVSVATGILVGGDDTGTGFKVGGIVGSCVGFDVGDKVVGLEPEPGIE